MTTTTVIILLVLLWLLTVVVFVHQRNVYLRTTALQIEQLNQQVALFQAEARRQQDEIDRLRQEVQSLRRTLAAE